MNVYVISDLHLCLGKKEKSMEIFGKDWENYILRIKENWEKKINENDLVLICGDISWGKTENEVRPDFDFIEKLPGKKIIIKGNHDYFWKSSKKLKELLPPSISFIHNNAIDIGNISIGGTRLWDTKEYNFDNFIKYQKNLKENINKPPYDDEKIFQRELVRLEKSLSNLNRKAKFKICMSHYPPIGSDLKNSKASSILEKYDVNIAVFGHLHHVDKSKEMFGKKNNIQYILTAADYINFDPIKIL